MKKLLILTLVLLISNAALFSDNPFGKIIPVEGIPIIKADPNIKVTAPVMLKTKDTVVTDGVSKARIQYRDGTVLKLMPNTEITFHKRFIRMKKGNTLYNFKKQGQKFKIYVPTALVGVFGTEFSIEIFEDSSARIALFSGSVETVALAGNKKRLALESGNMITVTKDGITGSPNPIKESIKTDWNTFLKKGTSSGDSGNSDEYQKTQKLEQELETYGNINYSVMPWADFSIDNFYKVTINGCSILNGKRLVGRRNQPLRMNGLEEQSYDFSILINGIKHDFTVHMDGSKNGYCNRIPFFNHKIELNIRQPCKKNLMRELDVMNELEKHNFSAVVYTDDGKRKLDIFHDGDRKVKQDFNNILWSRRVLFFCYPEDIYEPPVLEFFYSGDLPLKSDKVRLELYRNQQKYKVTFE